MLFLLVKRILVQSDELEDDGDGAAQSGTEVDAEGTGSDDGDGSGNAEDSYLSKVIAIFKNKKVHIGIS